MADGGKSTGIVDMVGRKLEARVRWGVLAVCTAVEERFGAGTDGLASEGRGPRGGGPAFGLHGQMKRMQSIKLVAEFSSWNVI